ncbi:MAG TPA: DUF1361 domain-containing protein [Thermoanaerobaculia bacterium]|nr:DUF1361 domain-containing protein [Thermoanaerobaculia bacterium]
MRASTSRALLFLALLGWCAALLVYRQARAGSIGIGSLPWNLFLAAIPPVAADLLKRTSERGWPLALQVALFVAWLLFLPNGPYLITDFIHLKERPDMPLWYDVALMTSVAAVGLLLAYASVADVQNVVTRTVNSATAWVVVAGSLLLSGFGIYLGRFLRWNSWDAVSNPRQLLSDIAAQLRNPDDRTLGVTVVYGIALLLGYVALRVFALTTVRRDAPR